MNKKFGLALIGLVFTTTVLAEGGDVVQLTPGGYLKIGETEVHCNKGKEANAFAHCVCVYYEFTDYGVKTVGFQPYVYFQNGSRTLIETSQKTRADCLRILEGAPECN